jgi:hypothetical protein
MMQKVNDMINNIALDSRLQGLKGVGVIWVSQSC